MELIKKQAKRKKMRDLGKVRRRKITIQKKEIGFDEWENPVEHWVDWRSLWAERSNLWGEAYYAARAVGEAETIEFTVRDALFLEDVNTIDYQIVCGGKEYDIKHIDRLDDDGMWIKFKCLERGRK